MDLNIGVFESENHIKNVKFLKNPNPERECRVRAITMAAAMVSFSLLSIPVNARPAIEVLYDPTRCVAAYDAAHKAAELAGKKSAAVRFARERKKWRMLLEALARLASIDRDLGVIQDIRDSIANAYEEQFGQIIISLVENEEKILLQIHDQCKGLKEEVQNAANPPRD